MKKSTYHIISAWALLFCFIAGQYMVYAHQHAVNKHAHQISLTDSHSSSKHIFKEKCEVCDSMHHTVMDVTAQTYSFPLNSTQITFSSPQYHFVNIGLILASGRAPPAFS